MGTVAKPTSVQLLDSTYGISNQSHNLQALAKIETDTVRVTIRQNSYKDQSAARIELLTPGREWTVLLSLDPAEFHDKLPSYVQTKPEHRKAVEDFAQTLFARASRILSA